MNIESVIQQAIQRAGRGYTRKWDTEAFKRSARNWRAVEKPERSHNRMDQLGLHRRWYSSLQAWRQGDPLTLSAFSSASSGRL
jgi:hypothetical protein